MKKNGRNEETTIPKRVVGTAVAGLLLLGAVSAVAAQTPAFACSVDNTNSTLEVSWDEVDGAESYQYKLSQPGEGNRYRRVSGTSVSITVDDPATVSIQMTPVFADRNSPARVTCSSEPTTVVTLPTTQAPTPTTIPRPPVESAECTVEPAEEGAVLRWNAIDGAVGYQYRVSVPGSGNQYRIVNGPDAGEVLIPTDSPEGVTVTWRPLFVTNQPGVGRTPCTSSSVSVPVTAQPTTAPIPATAVPVTELPTTATPTTETPTTETPTTVPETSNGRVFVSEDGPISSNFDSNSPDDGPQCVSPGDTSNNPGLRYGHFLIKNSPFNAGAANGAFSQCISLTQNADGSATPAWTYDWLEQNGEQDYEVRSFPEIIYGTKAAFETSVISDRAGLPARYSELPEFQIDFDWEHTERQTHSKQVGGETIYGESNVAIETFFHSTCDIRRGSTGSNREFEVMLWLDRGAERNPDGRDSLRTVATIDGAEYEVWTKGAKDPAYIAFVAVESVSAGSINWSSFLEYARVNGESLQTRPFNDDWCMANIIFGTEIWWGAGSFQVNQFDVTRTYR